MSKQKTITICSSANFYRHVNEIAEKLEKRGYAVLVPASATKMKQTGNYDVVAHKSWYENPEDFHKKAKLMRGHFDEVAKADGVLVVNDEKKGIVGYIGSNTLMEMGLAFYQNKPIYVLNPITHELPYYEEIVGMGSHILNGDLTNIKL